MSKEKEATAEAEQEKKGFECGHCGKTWRGHDIFCPLEPRKCEQGYCGADAGHKWDECVCFVHTCFHRPKVGECVHEWSDLEFDGTHRGSTLKCGTLTIHSCIKCKETRLSVYKSSGDNSFHQTFRLTPLRAGE